MQQIQERKERRLDVAPERRPDTSGAGTMDDSASPMTIIVGAQSATRRLCLELRVGRSPAVPAGDFCDSKGGCSHADA
jgi:hypothetical protein